MFSSNDSKILGNPHQELFDELHLSVCWGIYKPPNSKEIIYIVARKGLVVETCTVQQETKAVIKGNAMIKHEKNKKLFFGKGHC